MCKVLVFAGTTEGRKIAEFLDKEEIPAHICVATGYGESLLPKSRVLTVSHERLGVEEMEKLIKELSASLVIDATHPYAAEVTKNIRSACKETKAEYLRLLREGGDFSDSQKDVIYVESVDEAVEYLKTVKGNILATTGSKEAAKYTAIPGYEDRVFLRVLSLPNVAAQCAELGFCGRNLICMQGPFSKELNEAMLRQLDCQYLVTKMSGTTGGFMEKWDAAKACGCRMVIVGRPLKEEGVSLKICKKILADRFNKTLCPQIVLVGIGMGSDKLFTAEAKETLQQAELIIGARRMVEAAAQPGQDVFVEYDSAKIAAYIEEHPEYEKIAIVLSGDVGFYSGAKKLLNCLLGDVKIVCGISSAVYFMSKIGKSWDDAVVTSAHGRANNLLSLIRTNKKVFSILGTKDGISKLAEKLVEYDMGHVTMYTGENLSYENEKVKKGQPKDFLSYEADPLSVVCVENPAYEAEYTTHGMPDEVFLRDKVPMTKEEIRTVSLSKLRLNEDSVCYDVGAGTGSVSMEMALRAPQGRVYAIEKKSLAIELLKKNKQKFAADHVTIIEGEAPQAMQELEAPTHAFIGGSSGNMRAIMELLLEKNPSVRMVINCIALESVAETLNCIRELPVTDTEIVQLCVSKAKELGAYHMMMGENPIYIISCNGNGKETEAE